MNKFVSLISLLVTFSLLVNAQKDDVEWLFPPSAGTNDVFYNQAFGPPDYFGPGGLPGSPGIQGPPGIGGIGGGGGPIGGGPGYKVREISVN